MKATECSAVQCHLCVAVKARWVFFKGGWCRAMARNGVEDGILWYTASITRPHTILSLLSSSYYFGQSYGGGIPAGFAY